MGADQRATVSWFCWDDRGTDDAKWRLVAHTSKQPLPSVLAVLLKLMENASLSNRRGVLSNWSAELTAFSLGIEPASVLAICEAMQGIGLSGDTLIGWDDAQYKGASAARMRSLRARNAGARRQSFRVVPPDEG